MSWGRELVLGGPGEPADALEGKGSILFVGTATVIIRFAGFTILTDPNFLHAGDHIHLGYGLTAQRLTNPAIEIEDLPPLDLVLLSHLHEDHFDRLAAEKLPKDVPIVTTPHAARALARKGFVALEALETWEALVVRRGDARLRITAMPGAHAKGIFRAAFPSVMGSVLDFTPGGARPGYRMYISGDTVIHDDLREVPKRFPGIDLALLHLGGTRVLGLLVSMDGRQGVEAIRIVDPRLAIPIHHDDYDRFKSPLHDFLKEVAFAGLEDRVRVLRRGESFDFAPTRPPRGEEDFTRRPPSGKVHDRWHERRL